MNLTDDIRDAIIEKIRIKQEFKNYKQFFRYKNFIICRLEPAKDEENGNFGLNEKVKKFKY